VPLVVCTTVELQVNEIEALLMLATSPEIGVRLLIKIDTVYSGFEALTAVPFTGIITAVTVVPYAACNSGVI
jgi:hypothetical protein